MSDDGYYDGGDQEDVQDFAVTVDHADEPLGLRYRRFEDGPLFVSGLEPGLPCDRAGIPVGYEIVAVNGVEVGQEADLLHVLSEFRHSGDGVLWMTLAPYLSRLEEAADLDSNEREYVVVAPEHGPLGLRWARSAEGPVYVHTVWGAMEEAGVPPGMQITAFNGVEVGDEVTLQEALEDWRASGQPELVLHGVMPAPVEPQPAQYWPWTGETGDAEYPPPPRPAGGGFGGPIAHGAPSSLPSHALSWDGPSRAGGASSPLRQHRLPPRRMTPGTAARFVVGEGAEGRGPGRTHRLMGDTWAAHAVRRTRHGGAGGPHDSYTTPEFEQYSFAGPKGQQQRQQLQQRPRPQGTTDRSPLARPLTQSSYRSDLSATGHFSLVSF